MQKGFTLVEVLVAVAIMVVIFTLGVVIDTRFYNRATLDSERDSVVALLAKTRSDAMNNVDEANHGLYVASSSYILFEGDSYALRNPALDQSFPKGSGITVGGTQEIVFKALEGSLAAPANLTLLVDAKALSIGINPEGMISW